MSALVSHGNNIHSLLGLGCGHTIHPVSARWRCLSEFAAGCFNKEMKNLCDFKVQTQKCTELSSNCCIQHVAS